MCNVSWILQTFYRIFIKDYSKIVVPLTLFTGKDKFVWNEKAKEAFKTLKKAFTSALILIHVDSSKPFFFKVDASNFVLDSILSQYGEDGQLHPITYRSHKLFTAEINYEIHNKELLAIIDTFKNGAIYLKGLNKQLRFTWMTRILNIS